MRKMNFKDGEDNKAGFKMGLRLLRKVILLGLCFALFLSIGLTSSANASVLENYSEGVKISAEIRPDIQQITEKLNKRILEATAEEPEAVRGASARTNRAEAVGGTSSGFFA
jgi:hypothetical protein